MARKAISGARARRNVRIAQMAGLALGVSAVALWALKVPGLQGGLPQKPEVAAIPVANLQQVSRAETPALDQELLAGSADRLAYGAGVKPPAGDPGPAPPPPPAAPASDWKYLAPITEAKRTLAVVSRSGKQKVMIPGRTWNGAKLLAVSDDRILVEDENGRHEVLRGERAGSAVQWTRMASSMPSAIPGARMDPAASNAAMIERQLRERGIEGAQASRFREEMRERTERRRAMAEGNMVSPEMMNALGLSEEAIMRLSPDELNAYHEKYRHLVESGEYPGEYTEHLKELYPEYPGADTEDGAPR